MPNVTVTWYDHDDRGLVAELQGEASESELKKARDLVAMHLKPIFGSRKVTTDASRLQIIIPEIPAWLYSPSSVYRKYLATQVELLLNGSAG